MTDEEMPTLLDISATRPNAYRYLQLKHRLAGKNVVLVMTGGNLSFEHLRRLLAQPRQHAAEASG